METKSELAKAIIAVMREVKGIEKNMNVGAGNNSYKGVADQDVKKIVGEAMAKHGLCVLPLETEPKTQIDRWEAPGFNGAGMVTKQSVFTEVNAKYLLLHESGQSQVISGYGQGVDSQDKGAGKATTYALKYALLYTFLIPTGKIDDADNSHSDTHATPPAAVTTNGKPELKRLKADGKSVTPAYAKILEHVRSGGDLIKPRQTYYISEEVEKEIKNDLALTAA